MRILFMGTPEFASAALERIAKDSKEDKVVGAVTRIDMPKNRGQKLLPPPVKEKAMELGIPVYQPEVLKNEAFLEELKELDPELIVVAAYGKILPAYILRYPKYGCINIHGSLLPKYRGAAPIQRAVMSGEKEIGVTIMYMEEGLDTGDMILKGSLSFEDENFGEIYSALAGLGADLVLRAINQIRNGTVHAEKQDDSLSSYAQKITKEDTLIDFSSDAFVLKNTVRGLSPSPCAVCQAPEKKLKLTRVQALSDEAIGKIGEVVAVNAKGDGFIDVKTGKGILRILRLIPEGKKEMSSGDFLRGRGLKLGDLLAKAEA